MNITDGIIIALIVQGVTIVGLAVGFYKWKHEVPHQNRKTDADADSSLGSATESMSKATEVMVGTLSKRVQSLEDDLSERNDYIESIEKELKRQGAELVIMQQNVLSLRAENDSLRADIILKEARIGELELRVSQLQSELDEYKP